MAYIITKYCPYCKDDTSHKDGVCSKCQAKKDAEARAKWEAMKAEEKIEQLLARVVELERRTGYR